MKEIYACFLFFGLLYHSIPTTAIGSYFWRELIQQRLWNNLLEIVTDQYWHPSWIKRKIGSLITYGFYGLAWFVLFCWPVAMFPHCLWNTCILTPDICPSCANRIEHGMFFVVILAVAMFCLLHALLRCRPMCTKTKRNTVDRATAKKLQKLYKKQRALRTKASCKIRSWIALGSDI